MFFPMAERKLDARRITTFSIIVITLLQLSSCQSDFLDLMEGDQAHLIFKYPCGINELILQAGTGAPFYHSTDKDVQRYDAGTYTCSVYNDTEILHESEQIGVNVDYPPGKVSCGVTGPNQAGNWVSLECEAPVGSLSGQIECYQNGEQTPSTSRTETNISLKQTILVKKSNFAVCCSSTFKQPKKRCECCDTMVDPIYNRQVAGPEYLCFDTIPDEGSTTSSLGFTLDSGVPETTSHLPTIATQPGVNDPNILMICLSVFAPIIVLSCLCTVTLALHRSKNLCTSSSQRTQDGRYSSVQTNIAESRV